MFSTLYNVVLLILALLSLPKFLYQRFFFNKYRTNLNQRFGFGIPTIDRGERPLVWIHAVSVGETKAVAKLTKLIKEELKDAYILVSSITETGQAEAMRSLCADAFIFLPFDLSWIIKPLVKRIKPDLVIISETDLWYHFLKSAKEEGAQTVLINGKISERSVKRLRQLPFFSTRLYSLVDLFLVQNGEYKQRFESLHIPPDKISTTGNLKLDDEAEPLSLDDLAVWKKQLGLNNQDFVIVIGSTHASEEALILSALQPLITEYPGLKILVVPRHPERFNSVADLLHQFDPIYGRLSQSTRGRILLIDAMGLLKNCFQIADVAIIGGSFVPGIGGHNILEPALYGAPVLFGPYMHKQTEFVEMILKNRGGEQLLIERLPEKVRDLIQHPDKRLDLGSNGKNLLSQIRGATRRSWDLIKLLTLAYALS